MQRKLLQLASPFEPQPSVLPAWPLASLPPTQHSSTSKPLPLTRLAQPPCPLPWLPSNPAPHSLGPVLKVVLGGPVRLGHILARDVGACGLRKQGACGQACLGWQGGHACTPRALMCSIGIGHPVTMLTAALLTLEHGEADEARHLLQVALAGLPHVLKRSVGVLLHLVNGVRGEGQTVQVMLLTVGRAGAGEKFGQSSFT